MKQLVVFLYAIFSSILCTSQSTDSRFETEEDFFRERIRKNDELCANPSVEKTLSEVYWDNWSGQSGPLNNRRWFDIWVYHYKTAEWTKYHDNEIEYPEFLKRAEKEYIQKLSKNYFDHTYRIEIQGQLGKYDIETASFPLVFEFSAVNRNPVLERIKMSKDEASVFLKKHTMEDGTVYRKVRLHIMYSYVNRKFRNHKHVIHQLYVYDDNFSGNYSFTNNLSFIKYPIPYEDTACILRYAKLDDSSYFDTITISKGLNEYYEFCSKEKASHMEYIKYKNKRISNHLVSGVYVFHDTYFDITATVLSENEIWATFIKNNGTETSSKFVRSWPDSIIARHPRLQFEYYCTEDPEQRLSVIDPISFMIVDPRLTGMSNDRKFKLIEPKLTMNSYWDVGELQGSNNNPVAAEQTNNILERPRYEMYAYTDTVVNRKGQQEIRKGSFYLKFSHDTIYRFWNIEYINDAQFFVQSKENENIYITVDPTDPVSVAKKRQWTTRYIEIISDRELTLNGSESQGFPPTHCFKVEPK